MDHILAKVKSRGKKKYFKLISDKVLYEIETIDSSTCVPYNPDHNLDEDCWFKIERFSQQPFCIDLLKEDFDSKDYDDLKKNQFNQIAYLFSVQGDDFYFQKITPSLFIKRKTLVFGEVAKVEESENRLVINRTPDAVYYKESDTLIFRYLATISSIFKGIDELYKEATFEEVRSFLDKSFIELKDTYSVNNVSKTNRKRIALAITTVKTLSTIDQTTLLKYIDDYCKEKLTFDQVNQKFSISTDNELKFLLYGINQRFYTTPLGQERRLANSIQPFN